MNNELLTVEAVAAKLSVVPDTVYRWVAKNKISHVKLAPKCIRIPQEAVDVFVRNHWVTGTLPSSPKAAGFTMRGGTDAPSTGNVAPRADSGGMATLQLCCPKCAVPIQVPLGNVSSGAKP